MFLLWRRYTGKYRYTPLKLTLFNFVDLLGSVLSLPFRRHSKSAEVEAEIETGKVRKILAIRLETLGDFILVTPALRALKTSLPDAQLAVLISPALQDVLKNILDVDKIFTYEYFSGPRLGGGRILPPDIFGYLSLLKRLRKERFDLVIDFRGDVRTIFWFAFLSGARHRVAYDDISAGRFLLTKSVHYGDRLKHELEANLNLIEALGLHIDEHRQPVFPVSTEDERYIENLLAEEGVDPTDWLVGIHCFARWWGRLWPKDRVAAVADCLVEQLGIKVLFIGAAYELAHAKHLVSIMRNPYINLVGKITIGQLAALLKRLDLLLCIDSGPMHLAGAVGTPTVSLFGPSTPVLWRPLGKQHTIIYKDVSCSPCRQIKCVCRTNECMTLITVDEVVEAVIAQLECAKWKR